VFTTPLHCSLSWARWLQSIPSHPISLTSILISSYPRLGLPCGLFPSGFPTKILHAFLVSPMRATWPDCLIFETLWLASRIQIFACNEQIYQTARVYNIYDINLIEWNDETRIEVTGVLVPVKGGRKYLNWIDHINRHSSDRYRKDVHHLIYCAFCAFIYTWFNESLE